MLFECFIEKATPELRKIEIISIVEFLEFWSLGEGQFSGSFAFKLTFWRQKNPEKTAFNSS